MLDRLGEAEELDWERASLDSASVPAPRGQKTGPNPTDKGKSGPKRHIFVVDRRGIPLAVIHTAANVHNSKALEEVVCSARASPRSGQGRPSPPGPWSVWP